MLSRAVHAVAAANAFLITAVPGSAGHDDVAPLVVDADTHRAMFAGTVAADVTRPAARLEIVLVGRPQADVAVRARVTASLLVLAEDTLPHAGFESLPAPTASDAQWRFIDPSPPSVRIRLPMPATDDNVRDSVSRLIGAVNSGRYGEDTFGARVISIDHIFAGCAPFGALIRSAVRTRVEQLTRVLGTPSSMDVALAPLPPGLPFEAPPGGMPHCSGGSQTSRTHCFHRMPHIAFGKPSHSPGRFTSPLLRLHRRRMTCRRSLPDRP